METKLSFEEKFNLLKEISEKIQSNTLSLEQTMALYEEGVQLAKQLQIELDEAKAKFEKMNNFEEIMRNSK